MQLLIIEDDEELSEIISYHLNRAGFDTELCHSGEDAIFYCMKQTYDLIILDRMLPKVDGLTILTTIRSRGITTPVIIVTAMDALQNKIEGLDGGADDYLIKPFEMEELLARVRALVRRPIQIASVNMVTFSNLKLNIDQNKLSTEFVRLELSKKECDLLAFFMRNHGQIISREMLLTRVWGADSFVMDSNLDNFICFLRKRLITVKSLASIKTIRGVGYRLEDVTK